MSLARNFPDPTMCCQQTPNISVVVSGVAVGLALVGLGGGTGVNISPTKGHHAVLGNLDHDNLREICSRLRVFDASTRYFPCVELDAEDEQEEFLKELKFLTGGVPRYVLFALEATASAATAARSRGERFSALDGLKNEGGPVVGALLNSVSVKNVATKLRHALEGLSHSLTKRNALLALLKVIGGGMSIPISDTDKVTELLQAANEFSMYIVSSNDDSLSVVCPRVVILSLQRHRFDAESNGILLQSIHAGTAELVSRARSAGEGHTPSPGLIGDLLETPIRNPIDSIIGLATLLGPTPHIPLLQVLSCACECGGSYMLLEVGCSALWQALYGVAVGRASPTRKALFAPLTVAPQKFGKAVTGTTPQGLANVIQRLIPEEATSLWIVPYSASHSSDAFLLLSKVGDEDEDEGEEAESKDADDEPKAEGALICISDKCVKNVLSQKSLDAEVCIMQEQV